MKIPDIFRQRVLITLLIVLVSLILIYTAISLLFFEADPLMGWIGKATEAVLISQERIASKFLQWIGSRVVVTDHLIMLDGRVYDDVRSGVLMRKWMALLVLITWLTPASQKKKLIFTGIIIASNFILSPFTIAFKASLNVSGFDFFSHTRMSRTPANLMNLTFLFAWLKQNQDYLWKIFARMRVDVDFMKRKSISFIVVIYLYLILGYFILGCFEFTPWVNFLFNTSHKILSWFNIDSLVEPHLLIGENGSLKMAKSCLGFNMMLLFASLVFLTGENSWTSWIYIGIGLIILNIANVMRLVLLFMHIQKHGTYVGIVDYHDLYDYIIYGIVFILWVIWFEKFSNIRIIRRK